MNCILIDDDESCRTTLKQLVQQVSYLNLVGVCSGAAEASCLLKNESVDLAFLDIEMPEMTGIDMLRSMGLPPTILTTSHKDYALEAFEYNPIIDYLVKPITVPRFIKAVEKAKGIQDKLNLNGGIVERDYFFVKKKSVYSKVPITDILRIEGLGDYIIMHTINESYTIHITLKAIQTKLSPHKFIRIHRSHIVHLDKISTIEDTTIFVNNVSLPVGALYKDDFHKAINML